MNKRRKFSGEFKANMMLALLGGEKMSALAFEARPTQNGAEEQMADLERRVGHLTSAGQNGGNGSRTRFHPGKDHWLWHGRLCPYGLRRLVLMGGRVLQLMQQFMQRRGQRCGGRQIARIHRRLQCCRRLPDLGDLRL